MITISPIARTNWWGTMIPFAPPNIDMKPEPILIFQPSILLSTRFTSSTCPKKSPSEVWTYLPTISLIFFILSMFKIVRCSIYTLCFGEICFYRKGFVNKEHEKILNIVEVN